MKKTILTTAAVLLAAVGGIAAKQIDIVPRPLFMEVSDSEEFRLSEPLALRVSSSRTAPWAARIFAGQLERIVSFEPNVVCGKAKKVPSTSFSTGNSPRRSIASRSPDSVSTSRPGRPRSVPCHANPATDRCLLRRGG